MTTSDGRDRSAAPEIAPAATTGDGDVDVSRELLDRLTEDRDRFARDLNDVFIRQLFAVSLDLHAALSRIEHGTGDRHAADKIRAAIDGLDQAIQRLRNAVVDGGRLGPARCEDR
ncbi:MAG TPA: histidine kinase [Streptosporangiaceae bacterium]|nr:histidine kinase [Streptosporangiaceae bacterium]